MDGMGYIPGLYIEALILIPIPMNGNQAFMEKIYQSHGKYTTSHGSQKNQEIHVGQYTRELTYPTLAKGNIPLPIGSVMGNYIVGG